MERSASSPHAREAASSPASPARSCAPVSAFARASVGRGSPSSARTIRSNPSFSGPRCDQTHQNAAHSRSSNSCSRVASKWLSAARTLSSSTSSRSSHSSSSCRRCGSASSAIARKCSAWRRRTSSLRRSTRAARARTRGSSRTSRTARRCGGRGSSRRGIWSVSRSASATRSAASSVQPPAKTARRANSRCSSGVSRSCDHSIVERSVRWRGSASRPPLKQVEAPREPLEDLRGRERPRTGSRELDRERHVVEAPAELADRASARLEAGAREEQLDRLGLGERRHLELDLAANAQALAARREHARGSDTPRPGRRAPAPRRSPARGCRGRAASRARRCASARPSFAPTVCAISSITSAGSRSGASPTQKAPALWLRRARPPPRSRAGSCPSRRDR